MSESGTLTPQFGPAKAKIGVSKVPSSAVPSLFSRAIGAMIRTYSDLVPRKFSDYDVEKTSARIWIF